MLRNYIKIAYRNLVNNKVYSLINISGLAIGMAVALLIGIWVADELQFDQYHPHLDRLAQVKTTQTFNGHTGTNMAVAIPLADGLRNNYGHDFKHICLASWNFSHVVAQGDKKLNQSGMWVQPDFPEMFGFQMLEGTASALKNPDAILISQHLAKALFGNQPAMGKTIRIDNKMDFRVGAVYEDLPNNSSLLNIRYMLNWDKYLTTEGWLNDARSEWGNHSFQLYVEIKDGVDMNGVTTKIKDFPKTHVEEGKEEIILHSMKDWRLHDNFTNGKLDGGMIETVWLFGMIGVFVLLLACINFMNLSTARSEKRAKEVGIRKAIGSARNQLIGQFLAESMVVTTVALLLALAIVQLSLPWFNLMAGKQTAMPWNEPLFWLAILVFTLVTGLVSGSYPAFYLSGFDPISVLKGTFRVGRWAAVPRKVLVVMQFTVSVTLIIGTVIVLQQVRHAKERPVGYTREGLIYTQMNTPEIRGHYDALRADLLKTGAIEDMAESLSPSTDIWSNQIGLEWKGKETKEKQSFCIVAVTHDFGNTVRWKIKEGRDFSRSHSTDTGGIILNEAAVKMIGFKKPVGEIIKWMGKEHPVIGVVKDMVMQSPYIPVQPTVFFLEYGWSQVITIRLKNTMTAKEAIAKIEPVFNRYNPASPFEYEFIDTEYAKKFSDEEKIGNLISVFAGLAIFISCLGLFGLASFVAEQRTKEIGVRKVLGATVFALWKMLSQDFVLLVIISCILAIPISWYGLDQWLQNFEYRTEIHLWIFGVAVLGALGVTLTTVSFQAIKAALANPVKSLRTE